MQYDPDPPDLVAAWYAVGLAQQFGPIGIEAARRMHSADLTRSLLIVEAHRGMDRLKRIQESAARRLKGGSS
jgi:hypothetical protein